MYRLNRTWCLSSKTLPCPSDIEFVYYGDGAFFGCCMVRFKWYIQNGSVTFLSLSVYTQLIVYTNICTGRTVDNSAKWGLCDYPYGAVLRQAHVSDAVKDRKPASY